MPEQTPNKSRPWVKILTNESTIGVFALTIVACGALYVDAIEIAGVATGGVAAMLKNIGGQD
jgi:hypothetical protein